MDEINKLLFDAYTLTRDFLCNNDPSNQITLLPHQQNKFCAINFVGSLNLNYGVDTSLINGTSWGSPLDLENTWLTFNSVNTHMHTEHAHAIHIQHK